MNLKILAVIISYLMFSALHAEDSCWKNSYVRGVGRIPGECGDFDKSGLLCYPKCKPGYSGTGPVCWQSCPEGYKSVLGLCWKPQFYWRSGASTEKECMEKNPGVPCEKCLFSYYPSCGTCFRTSFCKACSAKCPPGMKDRGPYCAKDFYLRKTMTPHCSAGREYDAGLCYDKCRADNYKGIGPVCWEQCPPDTPVNCGAMCGETVFSCVGSIGNQVFSVGKAAVQIAMLVASLGTSSAGTTAASAGSAAGGAAAGTAAKSSAASSLKKLAAKVGEDVKKKFDKLTDLERKLKIIEELKKKGVDENMATALATAAVFPKDFDFLSFIESVDPTGLSGVVKAFWLRQCSDIDKLASKDNNKDKD
jgi:hypothetical protein